MFHLFNQQEEESKKMDQYQDNSAPEVQKILLGSAGRQNVLKLYMNDKPVDILWGTVANLNIISKEYINSLFSNVVMKDFYNILSDVDKSQVRLGN